MCDRDTLIEQSVSAQTAKVLSNHSMKDLSSHQVESSTTVKSTSRQFS